MSILNRIENGLQTVYEDIQDGFETTSETMRNGSSPNNTITRRHYMEGLAALLGAREIDDRDLVGKSVSEAGEYAPEVKWQVGSFGNIDEENDVDQDLTPTENVETSTEDDWTSNYDVSDFMRDLDDQGEASVAATNEFFTYAYDDAGDQIDRVGINDDTLVVNNVGADMYDTEPGLGYNQEFGETLKALDNEDELEGVVEGYIEQELV